MNNEYLARAREVIPDAKTLIIVATKRARALDYGARPMVRCKAADHMDVALLEIAEGLLQPTYEKQGENDILQELQAAKEAAIAENPEKQQKKDM